MMHLANILIYSGIAGLVGLTCGWWYGAAVACVGVIGAGVVIATERRSKQ